MFPQSDLGTQVDSHTQRERKQPGKDDDVVIQADAADNADAADESRGDKDGAQIQSSCRDCEDGRPPVRDAGPVGRGV